MADVNLLVEVTSAGVPKAVQDLEKLQAAGKGTGNSLVTLGRTVQTAMNQIGSSTSAAGSTFSKFDQGIANTKAGAVSLTAALRLMDEEYSRIAAVHPGVTARERLTFAGGGAGLTGGLAAASTAQVAADALSATLARDKATVDAEDLALVRARTAAQEAGLAVTRSQVQLSEVGLSAQARAQAAVTRATQEQAAALKEVQRVFGTAVGAGDVNGQTAKQNALTEARLRYAAANREVAVSEDQLAAANRTASNQNQNAFQSSFSYFIIAGLADKARDSILGIGKAALSTTSQMSRSFADVERTFDGTGAQLDSLKVKLRELSTQSPFSFVDLAQTAALGNQLGIQAKDIESFTTTISQYSLISGQSTEDAATAFGRIANLTSLPASQFSNLASSIEYVARTSVATETTITNTAKEITALASGAGFSADAIVGLSGALSSLAIPPERARGALSLYFGALNDAVASGGPKLEAFSTLTGLAASQLETMVRNNQGQQVFTAFIKGLSQLDTVAKTSALDTLGLSTIRVDQTMRALAQNVPLVTASFAGANQAFNANTELGRQNAIIQEQLATKTAEFQHAVENVAGAIGSALAPAALTVLGILGKFLIALQDVASSPFGQAVLAWAGFIGVVILAITTVIGGLALLKATMVIIPWALTGLSAEGAAGSVIRFALALFGLNAEAKDGVLANVALASSFKGVGIAAETSSVGIRAVRGALISTGIGLALVVIGALAEAFLNTADSTKTAKEQADAYFGSNFQASSIAEALGKDQAAYKDTGDAIQQITTKVKTNGTEANKWVGYLQTATGAQIALGDGTTHATHDITTQTVAYGDNAKAALANALANSSAFQKLFKDTKSTRALASAGFDNTSFARSILGDPIKGGSQYLDTFISNLAKQYGSKKKDVQYVLDQYAKGVKFDTIVQNTPELTYLAAVLGDMGPAYKAATGAAAGSATEIAAQANKAAAAAAANNALTGSLNGTSSGFLGAADGAIAYRDAIQSGLSKFVDFSTVMGNVKDALKLDDVSKESAAQLGDGLAAANGKALDFFNGLQTLAATGATTFASELAAIGPDAQGILSSALSLSSGARASIETQARLAAFLASDQFKAAFKASMSTDFDAYAQIFKKTGNLSDVQAFISAQIAGTGAEFERQWDAKHPDAPLNITLIDPTPADIAGAALNISKNFKVTATVTPHYDGSTLTGGTNTFSDLTTGKSIRLPANLDKGALSASLAAWAADENQSPEDLAAKLNTAGFSVDIDKWIAAHGPIVIGARIQVSGNIPHSAPSPARGGIPYPDHGSYPYRTPAFAGGGQYGQFQGPGTGTSDSIWARVSRGEFISTAAATQFWGTDFMSSLNRKMLPTSFLGMLGAASGSGNSGPSHVAYVSMTQHNPLTRDPLKQLREESENLAAGIWG